jgi:hypothetical protein
MQRDAEKKERERHIIETVRKYSACIPDGDLVASERPDWLIPSVSIGLEVSEILPSKSAGRSFSGPQLSSFQKAVVVEAEALYYSQSSNAPADVLIFFENEWTRKGNVKIMAQNLAEFVFENLPDNTNGCVTLQPLNLGVRGWVEGLSVVRILRQRGRWQAAGSNDVEYLTYEELARRIAAKDILLSGYRSRHPGWQMWLLLATRLQVLDSLSIPLDIKDWQFRSGFDKVILSSWDSGVVDIRNTRYSS